MTDAEEGQPLLTPPACPHPEHRPAWRRICSWHVLKIVLLGQLVSMLICGTSVTSQLLVSKYMVNTPLLQNFLTYLSLAVAYTVWLACRSGESGLLYILKSKWWRYLLLAVVDVEANYCLVKAFQFTTITSVQLLDCSGIPALMAFSWFFLHARFKPIQYIAVISCLLGVGTMVWADFLSGREDGKASDMLVGDALVILGACLYAVSNICQEYVVKNLSCVEFLGMLGLFASFVSGIQLLAMESEAVASIHWSWEVGLLLAGFTSCMFCLYTLMTFVIRNSSATSINLGMLTADIYSVFFSIFLFGYKFSGLYILSFVIIMVGFSTYSATVTFTPSEERRHLDSHTPL